MLRSLGWSRMTSGVGCFSSIRQASLSKGRLQCPTDPSSRAPSENGPSKIYPPEIEAC